MSFLEKLFEKKPEIRNVGTIVRKHRYYEHFEYVISIQNEDDVTVSSFRSTFQIGDKVSFVTNNTYADLKLVKAKESLQTLGEGEK